MRKHPVSSTQLLVIFAELSLPLSPITLHRNFTWSINTTLWFLRCPNSINIYISTIIKVDRMITSIYTFLCIIISLCIICFHSISLFFSPNSTSVFTRLIIGTSCSCYRATLISEGAESFCDDFCIRMKIAECKPLFYLFCQNALVTAIKIHPNPS